MWKATYEYDGYTSDIYQHKPGPDMNFSLLTGAAQTEKHCKQVAEITIETLKQFCYYSPELS